MILLIREYLASLKERGELDAILPDLLTGNGFEVISRPSIGTSQYGVDVAAIGEDIDGVKKLFLFSIKSGDLTRAEWNSSATQSIRPSLDEIRDGYIPSRIPSKYKGLKVAICLCFGGGVAEEAQQQLRGYTARNTTGKLEYQEWNGDLLAQKIEQGILRENLFPTSFRNLLRKASAMVEEPEESARYFRKLVNELVASENQSDHDKIRIVRQLNISLWVLFVWSREAGNVAAAYLSSEYCILRAWDTLKGVLRGRRSKKQESAGYAFNQLVELNFTIWDELYGKKILPHVGVRDGISSAVQSPVGIDVNLKIHETLGRIALRGLWRVWQESSSSDSPELLLGKMDEVDKLSAEIAQLITNNRVLLLPILDDHAVDIGLAITFLASRKGYHSLACEYITELSKNIEFAFKTNGPYPTCKTSYRELVEHPSENTDTYRQEATAGSVLIPLLAYWSARFGLLENLSRLAQFAQSELQHCTHQFWFPDNASEDELFTGTSQTGNMLTDIPITDKSQEILDFVSQRVHEDDGYRNLSCVKFGHWILVLVACRYNRLPVPPHIWERLVFDDADRTRV